MMVAQTGSVADTNFCTARITMTWVAILVTSGELLVVGYVLSRSECTYGLQKWRMLAQVVCLQGQCPGRI